ncbi:MAG: N-acetylmuramic acid 6-phosphate etherase [Anaerolineae bacterium]|nr:N-acetylmuramic acid 6-phosphate etherase [Anaerolineae bacterium]
MLTEQQNPRSQELDRRSTLEILEIMNNEDASVAGAVRRVLPAIAQAVDVIAARLRDGGRLIYMGAGTSGRLGILDAVECVPTFDVPPTLVQGVIAGGVSALIRAAEGAEDDCEAGRDDLAALGLSEKDAVVGIAASGNTPYVVAGLEYANEIGAATVGVTCNSPAAVLDTAQIAIPVLVGPEVLTGSTRLKAGTAQKMVLNMISTAAMIRLGKVYGNLMVDVQVTNNKLADRARRIVAQVAEISADEAGRLLAITANRVKPAIVMALLDVTLEEADALLAQADGHLSGVLPPRAG